ncbi:4-hydroxy-3-methylbut-2-enyl diphosphate reductase [Siccirubricoccus sp. KC 17139]|uniref:4-hydroxy-3-methylbut-2-enyl diphosphate reductase n=1 Tax=Siccirubricoccus soli TaxID=2899147 RepID=A0ABT1D084_9PROT|nr:4-hydroxy-3-methylbut-2-enyl diphosphate reductase [Siccirubricoccus soli]MCO6415331.1 4-hydroxy-3-methylbut-2-enyl diphosphate reductase [Siccirubricoccus soli]MCP2681463.1 4-hydroxy-3-methylbut-2-enyl diphosphate reductase [Siccirubricoccus soli]
MRIILAQPRGFCAGVVRAVEIVERALEKYGAPVFVRHEIVHNKRVVQTLEGKGARFVKELDEVPAGAVTVFSAHGVSRAVEQDAAARGLPVLDATCPLVSKVHAEGRRYLAQGRTIILIGHAGHPEVEGTLGQIPGEVHLVGSAEAVDRLPIPTDRPVAFVTQTTLSVDDTRAVIEALRARFTDIVGPDTRDICYATQNRQSAVRALARQVELLLVVGSANSSNSNRLAEIGAEEGVACHLIPDAAAIRPEWLAGVGTIGLTAGASAPETLVQEVIAALRRLGPVEVSTLPGIVEDVQFKLPAALTEPAASAAS